MKLTAFFVTLLLSFSMYAQVQDVQEPLVFESPQQQARFDELTKELRCLVCQNQNLADSDAPLAHDLRREVHAMLQTGQSDEQISC
jgi:cytochrome c-type biogenesis protein CcmH